MNRFSLKRLPHNEDLSRLVILFEQRHDRGMQTETDYRGNCDW